MLTYSIAIRTLGTSGDKYYKELVSITKQTVQPQKVLVYIAEGYERPVFTVGKEEYIWVKKGMVTQRILPYDEITSDCILMLDDDILLSHDSVEKMLSAMDLYGADCVGADIYKNQDMSLKSKLYAIISNLVFPHYSKIWAFKIHHNGSFSYNNAPNKPFYWSQSCSGGASLWKKSTYKKLHLEDELWLDKLGFPYGEDYLTFYKLYKNGFKLGILYYSCIEHLDGGTASISYRRSPRRMYIRSLCSLALWWRTCYKPKDLSIFEKTFTSLCFTFKAVWTLLIVLCFSIIQKELAIFSQHVKGLIDGWKFVHTDEFKTIRNYIIK